MIKKIFSVLALRVFGVSVNFLLNILVARSLPVSDAGVFFTCFSVLMLWGLISTSGFCDAILKFYPFFSINYYENKANSISLLGALFSICIGVLISLCVYVYYRNTSSLSDVIYYVALAIPLLALIQYVGYVFQSKSYSVLAVLVINICYQSVFCLTLSLILWLHIFIDVSVVLKTLFFSVLMGAIVAIFFFIKILRKEHYTFKDFFFLRRDELKMVFVALFSFAIILISNSVIQWVTPVVANIYLNSADIARLSICLRVGLVVGFFLISLNIVFAPKYSRLYAEGNVFELKHFVKKSTRMMFLFSIPVIATILIFPSFILSIFGAQYQSAVLILRIIALGQLVNVMTGSVAFLLTMTGGERTFKNVIMVNAVVLILNLFLLGKFFGITGLACAVAFSMVFQNLVSVYFVYKRMNINMFEYLYKV